MQLLPIIVHFENIPAKPVEEGLALETYFAPKKSGYVARFVDQALKQFAQYDVQPELSIEEQLSEVDAHGDYEGTINHVLSAQSLY